MSLERIACSSIDVGLIIYNERAIIAKSLDALLAAGFDSFVIVDMQSTDGTTELLREKLGEKAKIVSFPRHSLLEYGYAEARNTCAVFSAREWLLFVDADEVLVSGVENGHVQIKRVGSHDGLFSIERHNLARDPEQGPDAIKVGSVEHHNRLYKPTLRLRYTGYIHEEIHVGDVSGWRDGGNTALVFDHYSDLKPVVDAEQKAGLYALMLMRAYNQPDARRGTNPWWFDHYVPTHIAATRARAEAFALEHKIAPSFYAVLPKTPTGEQMQKLVPFDMPKYQPIIEYVVRDVNGVKISAPRESFMANYLNSNVDYEPHLMKHFSTILQEGDVVVDIGANVGYYTMLAALRVGSTGRVIAIEADQANAQCIVHGSKLNSFSNVDVWPIAASRALKTEALLVNPTSNSGTRDLDRVIETNYALIVGMPLDLILSGLPKVDIIKIDIEAREHPALLGCVETLKKFQPVVFSEFTPHAMLAVGGEEPAAFLDFMFALNYNATILHLNGIKVQCHQDSQKIFRMLDTDDYRIHKYLDLEFTPRNKRQLV